MWIDNVSYQRTSFSTNHDEVRIEGLLTSVIIRNSKCPVLSSNVPKPTHKPWPRHFLFQYGNFPRVQFCPEFSLRIGVQVFVPNGLFFSNKNLGWHLPHYRFWFCASTDKFVVRFLL